MTLETFFVNYGFLVVWLLFGISFYLNRMKKYLRIKYMTRKEYIAETGKLITAVEAFSVILLWPLFTVISLSFLLHKKIKNLKLKYKARKGGDDFLDW